MKDPRGAAAEMKDLSEIRVVRNGVQVLVVYQARECGVLRADETVACVGEVESRRSGTTVLVTIL